jgi:hypothetical protein
MDRIAVPATAVEIKWDPRVREDDGFRATGFKTSRNAGISFCVIHRCDRQKKRCPKAALFWSAAI